MILILTKFGILISTWFQIVPFGLRVFVFDEATRSCKIAHPGSEGGLDALGTQAGADKERQVALN